MRKALAALLALVLPEMALAQPPAWCRPYTDQMRMLSETHGETSRGMGLRSATMLSPLAVVQIMVNAETGSWTVLATSADGKACIIAAGTDWQEPEQDRGY